MSCVTLSKEAMSRIGPKESGENVNESCLARTVRADDGDYSVGGEFKGQFGQRSYAVKRL